MPESNTPPSLPFKFVGGFALPTKTIGFILSCQGLLQMIVQFFVFPKINARLGSLRTFRFTVFGYPILYCLVPYLTLVPTALRYPAIFFVLLWKVTAQSMSYPSNNMILQDSAPSKKVLGTLNGVSMSAASLARTLGPVFAGMVQAIGLKFGYSGLSWWACAVIACIGASVSLWQTERPKKQDDIRSTDAGEEEESLQEALLGATTPDLVADDAASVESTLVDEEERTRLIKEM
jgi:predicted MFS family arabinose efflux permease